MRINITWAMKINKKWLIYTCIDLYILLLKFLLETQPIDFIKFSILINFYIIKM